MSELIEFSNEDKRLIKQQFFPPQTTDLEMQYCMGVAKEMGLNPILKEIYFIERSAKVGDQFVKKIEPMVGKAAYLKLAHKTGNFDGLESYVEVQEVPTLINGEWAVKKELVATAIVYKKDSDRPVKKSVPYSEYMQKKTDGSPTKFWAEKPTTMLKKVAESQALREAFSLYGAYDESEINSEEPSYESKTLQEIGKSKAKKPRTLKKREVEAMLEAETMEVNQETGEIIESE